MNLDIPLFKDEHEIPHGFTGECHIGDTSVVFWFLTGRVKKDHKIVTEGTITWWDQGVKIIDHYIATKRCSKETFYSHPVFIQLKLNKILADDNL